MDDFLIIRHYLFIPAIRPNYITIVVAAKKKETDRYREIRNRKIFRDFTILEKFEAGIVLRGTEVKSIREGRAQINDAFVRIEKEVPILFHSHISEYAFGNLNNHNPYRPRKLLLHRREIRKLSIAMQSGGKALVPVRLYFKKALVKVEIALCVGKKLYDKREDLKMKAVNRDQERNIRIR